jgi:hypothetical protein
VTFPVIVKWQDKAAQSLFHCDTGENQWHTGKKGRGSGSASINDGEALLWCVVFVSGRGMEQHQRFGYLGSGRAPCFFLSIIWLIPCLMPRWWWGHFCPFFSCLMHPPALSVVPASMSRLMPQFFPFDCQCVSLSFAEVASYRDVASLCNYFPWLWAWNVSCFSENGCEKFCKMHSHHAIPVTALWADYLRNARNSAFLIHSVRIFFSSFKSQISNHR